MVTGSSRGLGRGIAVELAQRGCSVAINYVGNLEAAQETARMCVGVAANSEQAFVCIQADVASTGDRVRLVDETLAKFDRLDILVNNAGVGTKIRGDVTELTEDSFEQVLRTNLQGPYFLTQLVANYWLTQRPEPALATGFKVIFVSSISANTASLNRGDYCISKAGLAMAVQLWALRLAGDGIQVVELRPGIMATDMTEPVREKYEALFAQGLVPQGRWGTGEDMGKTVGAIVAGDLPFSTGAVIPVDGGFHIRRL
ncbi:MAG TPA: 3-ketoacyl-ACP reductase [Candidatus Dormibacteraeota bacterium]|nr:3-ketoacyl-ACP reductase [Candidatus Dormibacteraeota bacterium]